MRRSIVTQAGLLVVDGLGMTWSVPGALGCLCQGLAVVCAGPADATREAQLVKAPVPFFSAVQEDADAMTDSLARM